MTTVKPISSFTTALIEKPLPTTIVLFSIAWLLLAIVGIYSRPLLPVFETRYASIAWEMWSQHHYLFPLQNGQAYPDKPPLLFWLINAGWKVFGVNQWWPRILPALFGLLNASLTGLIASRLWPQQPRIALISTIILLGSLGWGIYANLILFDIVLSFFMLLTLYGILIGNHQTRGFIYIALGVGLGIITKGPIILVYTLPFMLLRKKQLRLPQDHNHSNYKRYYTKIILALLGGIAIALAWAIPAAISGGPAYAKAIFISQSIGRLFKQTHLIANTHAQPLWWYLPFIPLALIPWTLFPSFWQALYRIKHHWQNNPFRFITLNSLIVLILLSMIHAKQLHYLIPLMPLWALSIAYLLANTNTSRWATKPFGLLLLFSGIIVALLPVLLKHQASHAFLHYFSPLSTLPIIGLGLLILFISSQYRSITISALSLSCIILLLLTNLFIFKPLYAFYDLTPIAERISQLQQKNLYVGISARYNDEYQFLGRLTKPLDIVGPANMRYSGYLHPKGWIIINQEYFPFVHFPISSKQLFNYQSDKVAIIPTKNFLPKSRGGKT